MAAADAAAIPASPSSLVPTEHLQHPSSSFAQLLGPVQGLLEPASGLVDPLAELNDPLAEGVGVMDAAAVRS